jgi:D-alanyl-D-alanine carboxypeptidase
MKRTGGEGNVLAKTATLPAVHALAGYMKIFAGENLGFPLMLTNHALSDSDRSDLPMVFSPPTPA